MAKKKGKTPESEFDEVFERVTAHITDWSGIYSAEDLIAKIHEKYPLSVDELHVIYQKMAETDKEQRFTRGGKVIQENLLDWIEDTIDEEELLSDGDEEAIKLAVADVFTEEEIKNFKDTVANLMQATVALKTSEVGDSQYAPSKTELLTKYRVEQLPEYQEVQEQIRTQKSLIKDRTPKDYGRVKRMVKSGGYLQALESFIGAPKRTRQVAEELVKEGYTSRYGKPLSPRTLQRDVSELRVHGFIEPTTKTYEYHLTKKGRRMIDKLRRIEEE
jgi:DNA-binding HxlR family transcriptional regulator